MEEKNQPFEPAFPVFAYDTIKPIMASDATLRDMFAAQTIVGLAIESADYEKLAVWAYEIADAMLEARKK